jgi:alpha-beta hydrolase superfamily lysophospholipase
VTSHTRVDLRIDLAESPGYGKPGTIAATLHLPDHLDRPPVLVCMPGAGYNRRYFDLEEPGYSEAEYHVARGTIVVAIDHLGVGDSTVLPPEQTRIPDVAAANCAAVAQILAKLADGKFTGGRAVSPAAVIGAGQSMGGFILVSMQAQQRPFDGLVVLGASMVCTQIPAPRSGQALRASGYADPLQHGARMFTETDWRFAFHWEDVPEHLVALDIASKPPHNGSVAPWGSATVPNVTELLLPGFLAREAAIIDVPVLVAMGERDVCQDPLRELAAFQSARDLALFVAPRMAHMHNFAGTRRQLWHRTHSFVTQVAASARA